MRAASWFLAIAVAVSAAASAADKPLEVKAGDAIPSKSITTDHLGPFKRDLPAVLPLVVVSFQTQATEKGGTGSLGMGIFSSGALEYTLDGVSAELMQKITDDVQEAVEAELKAAGWQILPAEQATSQDTYKSWAKSPDPSGVEGKRSFFSVGKGTNQFTSSELERVFVGGKRPLLGNGPVLGGWTAAPSICKLGLALNAKVILFRAIVNFANISGGKRGLFTGNRTWTSQTDLEVSYAEMDVYPPDANGTTPARLHTDLPVTLRSDFVKDVQKSGSRHTVVADPDRYAKDTVEAIRTIAKGFAAQSK
jgi:hypothetical protein